MEVKVLIKRIVPTDKLDDLMPLLLELRTHAANQPGYITGETLQRVDNPGEELVISTWKSFKAWRSWLTNKERMVIQQKIDDLLGEKTLYEVHTY